MKTTVATLAALVMLTVGSVKAQTLPDGSLLAPVWAQTSPNGVPIVRLDKSIFASGEAVFFWVGVQADDHGALIPREYRRTCRLIITRPDGTKRTEQVGWPIDGPEGSGWKGGWGLQERPQPGHYRLVFEFAGQKSAPATLTVEDLPVLKDIKADFVFGPPLRTPGASDRPVTLTVHNNTDQTLRFPHRDGLNGLVSVSFAKSDGKYHGDGFYPADRLLDQDETKMPDRNVENFTWKDALEIPTITLKPGETYTQRLSLRAAIAQANKDWATSGSASIPSGQYRVTFSTTLQVLIGEAGGEFAAVSPLHVAVASAATCTVGP